MNIGVVIPSTGSYYSEIVHGIHDEFRKHEYCIILAWNPEEMAGPDSKQELELIHSLVDRRVDGIILRPTHADVSNVYFSEVLQRNIPMVTVDRLLPGVTSDFAGTDDERGASLATRHLLEAGHRRLVHVAIASAFEPARLRRAGFDKECAAVKGTTSSTIQIERFGETDLVMAELENVLRRADRPTALFLASDDLALGVYRAARKAGLRIPGDLSVVGFGNTAVGEWLEPPLTSIDQSPRQMGENAARMIIDRILGEEINVTRMLSSPVLVERGSVARL
jgi:LacI family transcriptional regulator